MSVSALIYGHAFTAALNKEVDLNAGDTIKCSLHTSSYSFDQDVHDYQNDLSGEASGTNYTTGGTTLTTPVVTYTGASNTVMFDADDASWTTVTLTSVTQAVVWADTAGASSADPLLVNVAFGGAQSVTAGTFQIVWSASGIFTVVVS